MSFTEQDADKWIADFEDIAQKFAPVWDLGHIPASDHVSYFVTDGVYSSSLMQRKLNKGDGPDDLVLDDNHRHWAVVLSEKLNKETFPGSVRAYSYQGVGLHYFPKHTLQAVSTSQDIWEEYLAALNPEQRLIPICYSLGAPIATLALHTYYKSSINIAKQIPAVIFVAPALTPEKELYAAYKRSLTTQYQGIPALIEQLCHPDGEYRQLVLDAFQWLSTQGIPIHIIYYSRDLLAPNSIQESQNVELHEVMKDMPMRPHRAMKLHGLVRETKETFDIIQDVLKKL